MRLLEYVVNGGLDEFKSRNAAGSYAYEHGNRT